MTIQELFAYVDNIKPNVFDAPQGGDPCRLRSVLPVPQAPLGVIHEEVPGVIRPQHRYVVFEAVAAAGSWAEADLKFDSEEQWRKAGRMAADRKRSFLLPVIPRRADHCSRAEPPPLCPSVRTRPTASRPP